MIETKRYTSATQQTKFRIGDTVTIKCIEEDDGSLGDGLMGKVVQISFNSLYPYKILREDGKETLYFEEELTLIEGE